MPWRRDWAWPSSLQFRKFTRTSGLINWVADFGREPRQRVGPGCVGGKADAAGPRAFRRLVGDFQLRGAFIQYFGQTLDIRIDETRFLQL